MVKNICVYDDDGVGDFSLHAVQHYCAEHNVTSISAKTIIEKGISHDTDIFVMPGGADRPYANKLNGVGNQAIRHYVENGGVYLGICAGAYYACSSIEFQKGTMQEICEPRELRFFDGIGIGCLPTITVTEKPYDNTLQTAGIANLKAVGKKFTTLYWGGCTFVPHTKDKYSVIATYEDIDGQPPAIISCVAGQGKAILSGVHFEVTPASLEQYSFGPDDAFKHSLSKKLMSPLFDIQILEDAL